ncbi:MULTISPECIES: twin-arginine translocase TatA/TatE family subunit [Microbacterium]|uniref:Sec-independent protein translocase protein TatA n=1 Tax=Microbacterium trichothecenolyticum TaxID=69370 RepID=A0A0M2HH81_MICTR|nr:MULTISPECIES: twin-arginine translocase TatA/TatE family subunit [Microbacterium]KJL43660.1 Sec-independent protein translocase protein TatA [Microbacterium trichothecenolyticum]MDR7187362.1 sec-independent protein translocase protein TatA [Microbacterium sp. BE35]
MLANLNGWHLLIVLAVILLLFGAARLPALARSVGQSARILKGEMRHAPKTAGDEADSPAIADDAPAARTADTRSSS